MKTILTLLAAALFAVSAQAQSLTGAHAAVWSLETAALEQMLNHIGAEGVTRLIGLQTATAQGINQALAAAGDPYRVPEVPGREFTVNPQTGYITVVPIEEEEEDPSE